MVSVKAEAVSLSTGARPSAGSFITEVMTGTSEIVAVAASEMTTVGTDFTVLGSAVKV